MVSKRTLQELALIDTYGKYIDVRTNTIEMIYPKLDSLAPFINKEMDLSYEHMLNGIYIETIGETDTLNHHKNIIYKLINNNYIEKFELVFSLDIADNITAVYPSVTEEALVYESFTLAIQSIENDETTRHKIITF